ncbi:MAG: single-stranded DNA-binding protein [Streptosporangiaceae bacterium]
MSAASIGHRNEVVLVGRLATTPTVRSLRSGEKVSTWRLVVDREGVRTRRGRAVDALVCATFADRVRAAADTWEAGDVVEVRGSLRRRFWRSGSDVASRYEIEVDWARRAAVGQDSHAGSAGSAGSGS